MSGLTESQRSFVHKTMEKYAVIQVKGPQWRINPDFLALIELKLREIQDPYEAIKKVVEEQFESVEHEIKLVIQSFVMEFVAANFSKIHMPEVKDTDIKDSRDLIDHLIDEEVRAAK